MSNALSPWPVVQNGSQGHPIRTLQFLLRAHGHNLAVDGIFGAATEAAVKAFQTSKRMTADGIVAGSADVIGSDNSSEKGQFWRRGSRRPRGIPVPFWRTR